MYKAIFFDIDDTIFNFEKCSRKALKVSCAICKFPYREETFSVFQTSYGRGRKRERFLQYFSELFVSDDVGYEKPDSRFFSECV